MNAAYTTRPTHPAIQRARLLAQLMDSALEIPVLKRKIGLDPILGLLPIGGDVVGLILSAYPLYVAWTLRLPGRVFVQMLLNIAIDFAVGSLPWAGEIFDAVWRANTRNVRLLEEHYEQQAAASNSLIFEDGMAGGPVVDVVAEPVL